MTLPDISLSDVKELQFSFAMAGLEDEARRRSPNRVKVLVLSIWYPLSISRYFEKALRNDPSVDLKTTGPYTGSYIPWMGGMNLLEKYAKSPDLPLPFKPDVGRVNYEFVKTMLGDWVPDLIISIDAGINWTSKPQDGYSVTIGTDPHVLGEITYPHARKISDKFFNMQLCYSEKGDTYLPYAYSMYDHYKEDAVEWSEFSLREEPVEKDLDAILVGMPYENRVRWKEELAKHGVFLHLENGPVFDEYRALANRAKIGCTWSSMNDLIARFFETPAFGLPMVANRVPDAHLFLQEDEDYLAFSTLPEAVEKVLYLKNHPEEAQRIAENGHRKILPHTYDERVSEVLRESGF
jgi:hypothetical protein